MMKATVDQDLCTGCGLCSDICPAVFQLDDDTDTAKPIVETVPADAEEDCRDAAESCPVEAIQISE